MAENPLDVHLAEYESLRQEILTRIQAIATLTSSLYAALVALVGAIFLLSTTINLHELMVFIPLITLPISMIWLEHVLQIHRIGQHLHFVVKPGVHAFLAQKNREWNLDQVMDWGASKPILPPALNNIFGATHVWLGGEFIFILLMPCCTAFILISEGWWKWRHPVILTIDAVISIFLLVILAIFARRTNRLPILDWMIRKLSWKNLNLRRNFDTTSPDR
jgi:hypothetical protein